MGKSLVIVESPAKAKTINKYLGKDYVVKSSVGHVRDLPTSGKYRGLSRLWNTPDPHDHDHEHDHDHGDDHGPDGH